MQVGNVYKNSNYKSMQVLSHVISSHKFKFLIPNMFEIKSPLLEIKNLVLGINPLVGIKKFMLGALKSWAPRIQKKKYYSMLLESILG
jgi:hypothetical protein